MLDPTTLFFTILFSAIGYGYYSYGKKQERIIPLVSGVALLVIPYGLESSTQLIIVGALLTLLPFVIRR